MCYSSNVQVYISRILLLLLNSYLVSYMGDKTGLDDKGGMWICFRIFLLTRSMRRVPFNILGNQAFVSGGDVLYVRVLLELSYVCSWQ